MQKFDDYINRLDTLRGYRGYTEDRHCAFECTKMANKLVFGRFIICLIQLHKYGVFRIIRMFLQLVWIR